MTYKKMAEMMIEKEACEWVKRLIPQGWEIWNAETTMEKHKDGDIMYDVEVTLWRPEHFDSGLRYTMTVGGCVSDYCGVCNSVIWRGRKGSCDVMWMNTKEAREELGIEEFALEA